MRARSAVKEHVLVARDGTNLALAEHLGMQGKGVVIASVESEPWIMLAQGATVTPLMRLHDIPATMNGLLRVNEENALFAVAMAWVQGLPLTVIRQAMAGFFNSAEQNPGRYNFIEGLPYQVLLDYGHNPDGLRALCDVVLKLPVTGKRLLISIVGNRFRHHLEQQVPDILNTFDHIFLSQDEAYFQKNAHGFGDADPLGSLLEHARSLIEPQLGQGQNLTVGRNWREMLNLGLNAARSGDLVVMLAEANDVLPLLKERQHHCMAPI
jgi:cyanophycin synthetase